MLCIVIKRACHGKYIHTQRTLKGMGFKLLKCKIPTVC